MRNATSEWRVLSGGVLAGAVLVVGSLLLGGLLGTEVVVATFSEPGMGTLGGARLLWYVVAHVALGVALVWIYVGIRPRYGAGPATAVRAGLAAWFVAIAVPAWITLLAGLARPALRSGAMLNTLWASAILYALATAAGAWVYREEARG